MPTHPSLPSPAGGRELLDVLVVGAGQAGLALGHHLARRGMDFLLLDAGPEIGHAWRSRWDSLRLFSPAQYDALPGLPFPAAVDTPPARTTSPTTSPPTPPTSPCRCG